MKVCSDLHLCQTIRCASPSPQASGIQQGKIDEYGWHSNLHMFAVLGSGGFVSQTWYCGSCYFRVRRRVHGCLEAIGHQLMGLDTSLMFGGSPDLSTLYSSSLPSWSFLADCEPNLL